ncbi:MAG: Hsp20/alpha crystallin family protein [Alphaproteobacteria bacterium]|nr:Hsp20/alpha crystallin family protein [Alphaproteobacteria bacterium]MCW5739621.1 Hsp20/alpha crystallin family protein [Alphaproteobacteria bacterium]
MARGDPRDWMWSEALQMLARAEGLHREVFRPRPSPREATWEPPVDVLETDDAVLILLALPGVDPAQVKVVIEGGILVVTGERVLPDELRRAVIHRLELPRGHFERRLELPAGRYDSARNFAANGCLVVHLGKAGMRGGAP